MNPRPTPEDVLHHIRVRCTEIIQDHRSGMPKARVLAEIRALAGELLAFVMQWEGPPHMRG